MQTQVVISGRYELVRPIGRGGMAEVWEARDIVLGRSVAVKTVHLATAPDPTLGDRLCREAVATAAIAHPDIVTVYDAGVDDGTGYIVMELLGGRDLAAVLRDGPLPEGEALRIGARIAGALTAAHAAGIVHRDVKPGNIRVDGERVTVVDFGIAAVQNAASNGLTGVGTTLGTAEYMAPEQAMARPATTASDMYSFGCLMTTMLAGRPPFTGDVPVALLHQHVYDKAPRLKDLAPGVHPEIDDLVTALLAKDPADRPTAVQAFDVLARLAEQESVTLYGSQLPDLAESTRRAAELGAVIAAAEAASWGRRAAPVIGPRALVPGADATPDTPAFGTPMPTATTAAVQATGVMGALPATGAMGALPATGAVGALPATGAMDALPSTGAMPALAPTGAMPAVPTTDGASTSGTVPATPATAPAERAVGGRERRRSRMVLAGALATVAAATAVAVGGAFRPVDADSESPAVKEPLSLSVPAAGAAETPTATLPAPTTEAPPSPEAVAPTAEPVAPAATVEPEPQPEPAQTAAPAAPAPDAGNGPAKEPKAKEPGKGQGAGKGNGKNG